MMPARLVERYLGIQRPFPPLPSGPTPRRVDVIGSVLATLGLAAPLVPFLIEPLPLVRIELEESPRTVTVEATGGARCRSPLDCQLGAGLASRPPGAS